MTMFLLILQQAPEETFCLQLKPKQRISIRSEFMLLLQDASISKSQRPLTVNYRINTGHGREDLLSTNNMATSDALC